MATTEPPPTAKKPWHPCDDCIDAIRLALTELVKSEVPGPEVYGYTSTCYSGRLGTAYTRADREFGRLWLASFISQSIADEFSQRLQSVSDNLRSWEERASLLGDPRDWPDRGDADDTNERTGLSRRLWDAFIETQDQAARTADYLGKLAAIIRSKLRRNEDLDGEQNNGNKGEGGAGDLRSARWIFKRTGGEVDRDRLRKARERGAIQGEKGKGGQWQYNLPSVAREFRHVADLLLPLERP